MLHAVSRIEFSRESRPRSRVGVFFVRLCDKDGRQGGVEMMGVRRGGVGG